MKYIVEVGQYFYKNTSAEDSNFTHISLVKGLQNARWFMDKGQALSVAIKIGGTVKSFSTELREEK